MLSIEQIKIEFTTFLYAHNASDKFTHELAKRKNTVLSAYVESRLTALGNRKYIMRNLITDAFAFIATADGTQYWVNLQRDWRSVCEALAPLNGSKPMKMPKKKQLYNSIW